MENKRPIIWHPECRTCRWYGSQVLGGTVESLCRVWLRPEEGLLTAEGKCISWMERTGPVRETPCPNDLEGQASRFSG